MYSLNIKIERNEAPKILIGLFKPKLKVLSLLISKYKVRQKVDSEAEGD